MGLKDIKAREEALTEAGDELSTLSKKAGELWLEFKTKTDEETERVLVEIAADFETYVQKNGLSFEDKGARLEGTDGTITIGIRFDTCTTGVVLIEIAYKTAHFEGFGSANLAGLYFDLVQSHQPTERVVPRGIPPESKKQMQISSAKMDATLLTNQLAMLTPGAPYTFELRPEDETGGAPRLTFDTLEDLLEKVVQ